MWSKVLFLGSLLATSVQAARIEERFTKNATCVQISQAISSASNVYYNFFDANYNAAIQHWSPSSTQNSACAVVPGSKSDLSKIIQILGQTRTPFGVKGGGHIMNPGFSSSPGVLIAMSRFNQTIYDPKTQTADVGAGLLWETVYSALEPYNVSVVGGRVSGVGVAGFTLGGGYSWFTNARGLTIDNIVGYNFIKPDGSFAYVTAASDSELFFALKGGFNNFGVVTSFVMKAYPQGPVWGGLSIYGSDKLPAINAALADFQANNNDPKANVIMTYDQFEGITTPLLLAFYNGPTPSKVFDGFRAIQAAVNGWSTRSLVSLVNAAPSNIEAGNYGRFHTVTLQTLTVNLLNQVVNQSNYYSNLLQPTGPLGSGIFISYDVEPFIPNILSHASGSSSAYPADRSVSAVLPLNLYFAWTQDAATPTFFKAIKESAEFLRQTALQEGQNLTGSSLYPNYCLEDTSITNFYGDSNIARMQAVKKRIDPNNVMGLTGGFKI